MPPPTLKIVIADDHEIVRQGVKNLLENEEDMEVCGEATIGRDAVDLVIRLQPDVAVLDISMPVSTGSRPPGRS